MALFRNILKHSTEEKYAYCEFSDEAEGTGPVLILGDREFDTAQEAIEWSKGFTPYSYQWVDPKLLEEEKSLRENRTFGLVKSICERLVLTNPVMENAYNEVYNQLKIELQKDGNNQKSGN